MEPVSADRKRSGVHRLYELHHSEPDTRIEELGCGGNSGFHLAPHFRRQTFIRDPPRFLPFHLLSSIHDHDGGGVYLPESHSGKEVRLLASF